MQKEIKKLQKSNESFWLDRADKIPFGQGKLYSVNDRIEDLFNFSYNQAIKLNQKQNWNNSSHYRTSEEMLLDTIEGKMGEEAIYKCANEKWGKIYDISPVDYNIYDGQENGDKLDFIFIHRKTGKEKIVAVRTVKFFSNLLLMETSKTWDHCDAIFLCRIKPLIDDILKGVPICEKESIKQVLLKTDFKIEIVGYLDKQTFVKEVKDKMILRQGSKIFGTTIMETENYYVPACSLKALR